MSSAATDKREEGDTKNIGFYDLGKVIGAGAYSKVRLATHVSTNQVFAVKIVDKSRIHNVKDLERVLREMHVLKNISHPNIISMHECIERGTKLFLVLDFASGGELYNYVVSKGKLQELEARQFFTQIMSGVDFCHRQEISHRDLKPENILLVEQDFGKYVCKIADFGLSNDIKPGELLKTICGTPCYAAPEIIMGQKYDGIAIDLWSLGATLYTLVVGRCPFRADNQPELFNKIQKGIYSIPSSCSPEVSDLIRGFMKIDSKKRIHISKAWEHPWIQVMNDRFIDLGEEFDQEIVSDFSSFNLEPGKEDQPTSTKAAIVQPLPDVAYELLFPNSLPHQYYAQGRAQGNRFWIDLRVKSEDHESAISQTHDNKNIALWCNASQTNSMRQLFNTKRSGDTSASGIYKSPKRRISVEASEEMQLLRGAEKSSNLANVTSKELAKAVGDMIKLLTEYKVTIRSSNSCSIKGEKNKVRFSFRFSKIVAINGQEVKDNLLLLVSDLVSGDNDLYKDICRRLMVKI